MTLKGKRIAVTGATGFVGRYIVDVLLRRGAHVVGVVRNPDRVPELAQRGVEMRKADLAAPAQLRAGFAGADGVVSNAALFTVRRLVGLGSRNWEEHHRANVDGTRNVFEACAAARVTRIVHISSVAVYTQRHRGKVAEDHAQLSERTWRNPTNAYALSKALSEQLAWRLAAEHGLALTTIRPCGIYGAFDANLMPVFKWLVRFPITIFPAGLQLPFVYAGDVAEAVALAFEKPVAIGKAYNITGDDHTLWQFAQAWKEAGGKSARCMIPLLIPGRQSFDHSRATRDLGWRNRSYVEGLRETLELEGGS